MPLILNIDTATEKAIISIARNGLILQSSSNSVQKDHASFLHLAIKDILSKVDVELNEIDAFAVNCGPGSYTGIRVGMASAKGFSFALNKPFLMINSLELLAHTASLSLPDQEYCFAPMIDARRMEVFTALYDHQLKTIIPPVALVLNGESFKDYLNNNRILFSGSGSPKFQNILNHPNASFMDNIDTSASMARLSFSKFGIGLFDDLIASEPLYIKDLYTP